MWVLQTDSYGTVQKKKKKRQMETAHCLMGEKSILKEDMATETRTFTWLKNWPCPVQPRRPKGSFLV